MTHLLDGKEVLGYQWAIQASVEGEMWRETVTDVRFPAETMAARLDEGHVALELPLQDVESYRARSGKELALWRREDKVGLKLLHAFERKHLLEKGPVREVVPDGWIRVHAVHEDGLIRARNVVQKKRRISLLDIWLNDVQPIDQEVEGHNCHCVKMRPPRSILLLTMIWFVLSFF